MKKTRAIVAVFSALILASCGGGTTNQNVGTSTVETQTPQCAETPQCDVSTSDTAPATSDSKPAGKPIVIEVAEKLAEKDLAGFSMNDLKKLEECKPEHIFNFRPWDMGIDVHCFPYKDDGCAVVVILDLVCDYCGMASSKEYKLFSYKDGTIIKINNLLPKPGIDDFYANAADFPKDTYNDLKKAIASTVWYSVTEDGKLLAKAEVVKWDGEDRILAKSLIPLVDNNESWTYPSAYYIWDGEKFVRDPEFKPLEQDLKVFGVTNKGGEFAQSGKTIAELYSGNKDSLSIAENDINGDGKSDLVAAEKHGGKLAVYWGGDDGYTLFKSYKTLHDVGVNIWDNGEWWIYTSYNEESEETTNEFKRSYHLRFQDGDFYLIGGITFTGIDIDGVHGWPQCYGGEFDLEKHTKYPAAGGDYDYESAETLKNLPLKKISDIAIGEYNFSDYNE